MNLSLTAGNQVFQDGNGLFQEFLGEGNVAQEFAEVGKEFIGHNIVDSGESLEGVVYKVEELMRHQEFFESTEEIGKSFKEFGGVHFGEGGESVENVEESSLEFGGEEVAELVEDFNEVLVEVFVASGEGFTDSVHKTFNKFHELFREEVLELLHVLEGNFAMVVSLNIVVLNGGNLLQIVFVEEHGKNCSQY